MSKKLYFRINEDAVVVFRLGRSGNGKITEGRDLIVQTYSFTRAQLEHAQSGGSWKDLFGGHMDKSVCFDCPMREKLCYTHKFVQARSFLMMLRSMPAWSDIPTIPSEIPDQLLAWCTDRYVRFGTYGEPILIPSDWVELITTVASSWTGYTHQWREDSIDVYKRWFMSSVETKSDEFLAQAMGWRTFRSHATEQGYRESIAVGCPAAAETGKKTNCAKCALCSGTDGKGRKSVKIVQH